MKRVLDRVRIAPVWVFVVLLVVVTASNAAINLWLAPAGFFDGPAQATRGLLHPTLLAGLIAILTNVVLALVVIGGVRPREFGIDAARLPAGLVGTLLVWLLAQAVFALLALVEGSGLHVDPGWSNGQAPLYLGGLLGQLAGNALVEETVFRGFVAVQLLLRLRRAHPASPRSAALLAVIAAGVLFALSHVPNRLMKEEYDGVLAIVRDQSVLVLFGMYFAWIYLRTQNLFVAVGVHALVNQPTTLVDVSGVGLEPGLLMALLGVVLTIAWPGAHPGDRFERRPT